MTERKFTPPTEFPAEYVDGEGRKAVILGRVSVGGYPLIGYILYTELGSVWPAAMSWSEEGKDDLGWPSADDLHDIPRESLVRWLVVGGTNDGLCHPTEALARLDVAVYGGSVVKVVEETE